MSQQDQPGTNLAAINSATLGINMPVVTLPDGQNIQTGTVGALMVNIREYDELVSKDPGNEAEKGELEAKVAVSMPVLKKAGIFGLFAPEDWIQGSGPGRTFVGKLALNEGL